MRFLVLAVLLSGCSPSAVDPPPVNAYLPAQAAAVGVASSWQAGPIDPEPSENCATCGGSGWLGDGQPRSDCPDCNTKWDNHVFGQGDVMRMAPLLEQIIEVQKQLAERIGEIEKTLSEQTCPLPIPGPTAKEIAAELQKLMVPPSPSGDAVPPSATPGGKDEPADEDQTGETAQSDAVGSSILWVNESAARESGRPRWYHFTLPNCRPCQVLYEQLDDPQLVKASRRYSPIKTQDRALMRRYGVEYVPCEVVVLDDGRVSLEYSAGWPARMLANFLVTNLEDQ